MTVLTDRAEGYRRRMLEMRGDYERAQAQLQSEQRTRDILEAWDDLCLMLKIYTPPNGGDMALFALGAIMQLVNRLERPQRIVDEYERLRDKAKGLDGGGSA